MNSTAHQSEAEKLRGEIAEAAAKVNVLAAQIRHREGRLRRIAADAFNAANDPLGGVGAVVRDIVLGSRSCDLSAIGVCVYSRLGRQISIPGQLGKGSAWDEACRHARTVKSVSAEWTPARTDACLFCGRHPEERR